MRPTSWAAARTVNDLENDDQQEGMRFGATVALPVNRYHSVKLYGITGYNAHRHHDFAAVGYRVAGSLGRRLLSRTRYGNQGLMS